MLIEQVHLFRLNLSLQRCRRFLFARPTAHYRPLTIPSANLASRQISDLGLRTQRPPDTSPNSDNHSSFTEISDQEWEIRTGRAIYVIQETFPEFFEVGLVMSVNKATGMPSRSSVPHSSNVKFLEPPFISDLEEPIYSPSIRMSYTPPSQLPPPFPKTIHIEGIQLYATSSGIIRRAMNALYSDLTVRIAKLVIESPPVLGSSTTLGKRKINRDKSFRIRQIVVGNSRVSGKPNEWEVESTYKFSSATGLIHQHIVDSILPQPHVAVYDSLRLSLGKVLGWGQDSGATTTTTTTNEAICNGKR